MNETDRGQVIHSAAEIYDAFFLPALFIEWPSKVLKAAQVEAGQSVLDVACGTGVLTVAAAERVGADGFTAGLDINEGMLSVARTKSDSIEWRNGQAESLPYQDHSFDAVVSQFALMFFEDQRRAISEMVRVLKPNGRLAVAVWDTLENTPGYAAVTSMLKRLFGDEVANALRAPYNLGDKDILQALFADVDLENVKITTHPGTARFPSIESWMFTDIKGWTLADVIDDDQYALLLDEAKHELQQFVGDNDTVAFSAPAHIVTAQKR